MENLSLNYPCRQTPHLDLDSSHHHGQGDFFYADTSCLQDLNTAGTLHLNPRLPLGATDLNARPRNELSLRIKETRGPTPSRQPVSRTSIQSSFTLYQHSPAQSHVASRPRLSHQNNQSLERRNNEEVLQRQRYDILGLQGPAHDRNYFTSTTPVSDPTPQRSGHGQDLNSNTSYPDHENVGYPAHSLQPFDPIFDTNTAAPPTPSSTKLADRLNVTNTSDQVVSRKWQLDPYAYRNFRDSLSSRRTTAYGRNWPTDTAPFNSHPPQTIGYGENFAPGISQSNGANVGYAAHPLQPYTPFLGFNSAATPPVLYPPYTSTPVNATPKIKSEQYEPPGHSSASHISSTLTHAPILSNHLDSPFLGTSTPSRRAHRVSKLKNFGFPTEMPSLRRRHRRRPFLQQQQQQQQQPLSPNLYSSRSYLPIATRESVDPSEAHSQDPLIDSTAKTESSEPSNVPKKDEVDFDFFLDMDALIEKPPNDCQVSSLNALDKLNPNNQNVPDAPESATAQNTADQPVGTAVLEPQPQLEQNNRKRTLFPAVPTTTALSTAISDPVHPTTKPRKNTNPKPVRKNPSSKSRRAEPKARYWCVQADCHASRNRGFGGFVTREDTRRHLLVHEAPSFVCNLPHKFGQAYTTRRKDNLEA